MRRSPQLVSTRASIAIAGVFVVFFATACSKGGGDTGGTAPLPDETGTPVSIDSGPLDFDTGASGLTDDVPAHGLTVRQVGAWELSPRGGPWTSLVGELVNTELLDGDEETPACTATWALTGEVMEGGCETCEISFQVEFYLTDGDPQDCREPDLPGEDEIRALGWAPDEGSVYFDYYGSGVWLPWYDAEEIEDEDRIELSWTAELAVVVEEEDDE